MDEIVYTLCALTSASCAYLLFRGYQRVGTSLLLWSTVCFVGLTIANALIYVDLIMFPDTDLQLIRSIITVAALQMFLMGLIKETV